MGDTAGGVDGTTVIDGGSAGAVVGASNVKQPQVAALQQDELSVHGEYQGSMICPDKILGTIHFPYHNKYNSDNDSKTNAHQGPSCCQEVLH